MSGRDLSGMDKGKVKRDKVMVDSKGTKRYVPYGKWRNEVVNNPTGMTAMRAKAEKDPDLKELSIDVIGLRHDRAPPDSGGNKEPMTLARPPRSRGDIVRQTLREETLKRLGFRRAEEGKISRQNPVKMLGEEGVGEEDRGEQEDKE